MSVPAILLLAMAGFPLCAQGVSSFGAPVSTVQQSAGGYQVTATSQITLVSGSPALISGGVNLLRVDGATPVVLGVMNDNAVSGSYTLSYTVSSASAGPMVLQVAAAFRGVLQRVKSPTGNVTVGPVVTQLVPNSAIQGQQSLSVAIASQFTHFVQGTTTASFGTGITVASLTVNSATSAMAVVNISAAAALGANTVTLTTGSETASLPGGFTVTPATLPGDSVTWHYDVTRSGVNPNETVLAPSNVTSASFGKVAEFTVDGQIDGQILYLNQLTIPSVGTKNVVYAATENDTVYALDAATISGSTATVLWKTSALASGETAAPILPQACGNISPSGITGTPVIDRARNAIYFVAVSENNTGTIIQRIHALSLTTGAELFGGPTTITASYPGTGGYSQNGAITFNPEFHHERAALLESGGTIYTVWSGMYGDCGMYSPWVIAYSADTLAQTAVIDLAPNNYGGGMWMGGAGPATDTSGNVYVITGNGFGGTPATGSYANSFIKLSTSGGLTVGDYFSPDNTVTEDQDDLDFGSAGPLLLPDVVNNGGTTYHLAVSAGKDGKMYVVNRDNMGQYTTGANNNYQVIALSNNENFSTPVYFNSVVYICPGENSLKAFPVANALLATAPSMQSTHTFGFTGAVASVSSNGSTNGIVWALDYSVGILYAFNATSITTEIYNSNQAAGSRDHFSAVGGHFITPMVSGGRVYFGTATSVVVFGLLQ